MSNKTSLAEVASPVIAVLLHCWLCVTPDVQAACRDTTVTQELLKEGFHR